MVASQTDVRAIIVAVLNGADADGLARLIADRRRAEPAMTMAFIDNRHRASLTHGSIAAIGADWRYTRYLGGFRTPRGVVGEQLTPLTMPPVVGDEPALLRRAVAAHLQRWGAAVDDAP